MGTAVAVSGAVRGRNGVVSKSEGSRKARGLYPFRLQGTALTAIFTFGHYLMDYSIPEKHEPTRRLLGHRWPHLFLFPVPLKIDIHRDILAAFDAEGPRPVSHHRLHRFLHHWTKHPDYKAAVERCSARYDLAGNLCPKYRPDEYWGAF